MIEKVMVGKRYQEGTVLYSDVLNNYIVVVSDNNNACQGCVFIDSRSPCYKHAPFCAGLIFKLTNPTRKYLKRTEGSWEISIKSMEE